MSLIKLDNVNKTYQSKSVTFQALKSINLEIKEGDFTAIRGRSGCGKSTLLNILGLMDKPDCGGYFLNDKDMSKLTNKTAAMIRNRDIGFVFQAFHLINELTVLENVEMPLGYAGLSKRKRREIAMEKLNAVGIPEKYKNKPTQLSGGQQQRVAIARAMVCNPKFILADEPTGNLDSQNGIQVMKLLENLNQNGVTIILVTHDEQVVNYAKSEIFIEDGYIIDRTKISDL